MKTTKHIVILLALALLTTVPAQSMVKPAEDISETRIASCLVKITADPAVLPLNLETVDYLLHSSGVGGKAARDVLGVSPDKAGELFTIEYVQLDVSDSLGGVGIPWNDLREHLSEMSKTKTSGLDETMEDYEMMMYEDMMRTEQPGAEQTPYSGSSSKGRSSSVGRSTSRTQPVTRTPSTRRSTTASTTQPGSSSSKRSTTGVRSRTTTGTGTGYSRRRGRGTGLYDDYYYSRTAAATPRRTRTTTVRTAPAAEQTYLFSLRVDLPVEVKPAAKEFMDALVNNLRQSLTDAYRAYSKDLETLLREAESWRDHAQSQLAEAMEQVKAVGPAREIEQNPADVVVYEQLEQIVDLSMLSVEMPFAEVISELKNSVEPPLQMQPNWKDLLENADVEPMTPAGMDPLAGIKLRKALEILLAGVSGDFAELKYVVDEGVIQIATADALPNKMVPRVYEIPMLAHSAGNSKDLAEAIQQAIEPDSWFDMSEMGEGTIGIYLGNKLVVLQNIDVHRKIKEFLRSITINVPAGIPVDIPVEVLFSEKNNLLREKQNLEMELARLQGRMPAIEEQIKQKKKEIDEKVEADLVSDELKKILTLQIAHLEAVKRLFEKGGAPGTEVVDAEEKLARAKIELARRREQIGASTGAEQLTKFSNELATLTVDLAEKRAMLEIIRNQLDQTEQQLTAATMFDPQASQIRLATQAFEIAERRVNELSTRAVNLQSPTVSMLGGE